MKIDLIKKYSLEFTFINDRICSISNDKRTEILAEYLDIWRDSNDIKEDLLPEIESVLLGGLQDAFIGAEVVGVAYVNLKKTEITQSDVGYSDMELPTEDFKSVIILWMEFLQNNGR